MTRQYQPEVAIAGLGFLCATFVFSVSLWWVILVKIHHRDTENTEDAQRLQTRTTLFGFVFGNQLPRLYCKISALRCLRFG